MKLYKSALKGFISASLLLTSGLVLGHGKECNYSMDYDVSVDEAQISFKRNNQQIIFKGDQLLIDGTAVSLSEKHQKASSDFQQLTRELVPKIADIAIEGTELGLAVANRVITSLFGNNDDVRTDLLDPINKVANKITSNINYETFNSKTLDIAFDNNVDQELEKFMSNAIGKYSARLAGNFLSAIFSNDSEEMEDLEFRMENLEHDVESYIESNIGDIEKKADALCVDFEELATIDEVLQEIDGFPALGIIQKEKNKGSKVAAKNLL